MKKLLIATLFLLIPIISLSQIDETIKYSQGLQQVYFPSPTIDLQAGRFEPVAPCFIKKITVTLTGEIGTARIRLFGYEAGDQIPDLMNDKMPPISIKKTIKGNQSIAVTLPEPVWFDNSWFWVAVDSISTGIYLLSDNVAKKVPYDTYYYQALHTTSPSPDSAWGIAPYAYFISVLVSYPTKTSPKILKNVTDEAGLKMQTKNSSLAAADIDGDGWIDLYFNNKIFHNNQNGTFTDITESLGVINRHNHKADSALQVQSIVDLDNDGDLDFVIFCRDTTVAFINDNGVYTEKILSIPELPTFGYLPLLANWADLNNDGYPDLYLGQQASQYGANGPDQLPSYIFINDKNNDFINESERMFPANRDWRRARASQWGDFNNDGAQDLYIANYFLNRDELYQNDGNGNFHDVAPEKNIDINSQGGSMHGCGFSWFDYNNDGNLDFMVARIAHARFVMYDHQGSALYRNEGPPNYNFTDLTNQYNDYPGQIAPVGLEYEDYHCSAGFADVNNDGLPDLLLKTYNPYRFISFYEQQSDHTFKMKRFEYGIDRIDGYGPGQVWLDYNNDGKIDLLLLNKDTIYLYKNTIDNSNNYLELDLRSETGNKFAIGAKAYIYAGDQIFTREVSCGQDEMNQYPYRLHFGLGQIQAVDSVVVSWPGKIQKKKKLEGIQVNHIYNASEEGGTDISDGKGNTKPNSIITNAYPNPFNQSSIISYQLSEYSHVIIKIYDEAGNEIRTLVNETQDIGTHEATFNADGLPQGSYYYKLQIGDKIEGSKLILVR